MELKKLKDTISKFAEAVITEAKKNANKERTTGNLANSLTYKLSEDEKGFIVSFLGADYADFQDKGVKGSKTSYTGEDSPIKNYDNRFYSYKDKPPPIKSMLSWVKGKRFQFQIQKPVFFLQNHFKNIINH